MFCYTDFTIPPDIRANYSHPKQWQSLRQSIWRLLHEEYGAIFALEATHPVGDLHPEVFHPHLNFLWIIDDKFKPYIEVLKLQEQFRNILNYAGAVNLYHSYGTDDAQLYHLCKYVTRIFPQYSAWAGSLRWYGTYPAKQKAEKACCPQCLKRVKLLGYISSDIMTTYDLYGFRLGRSPPWENDLYITPFKNK